MKGNRMNRKKSFFLLMTGLMLLALTLSFGVAFARYQSLYSVQVNLENTYSADQAYLLGNDVSYWSLDEDFGENYAPADTWIYEEDEDAYYLDFYLSNGNGPDTYAEKDQNVTLQVAATVEDYSTDRQSGTVVKLVVGNEEYIGTAEPIIKGTVFWRQYGEGKIYRFCNEAGEEMSWTLMGGQLSEIPMQLVVAGGEPNTVFTLMTGRAIND